MAKTNITRTLKVATTTAISFTITIITIVKTSIFYGAGKFPHPLNSKVLGLILGNFWDGDYAVWTEPYITVGCLFILSILAWATTAIIFYRERKTTK